MGEKGCIEKVWYTTKIEYRFFSPNLHKFFIVFLPITVYHWHLHLNFYLIADKIKFATFNIIDYTYLQFTNLILTQF